MEKQLEKERELVSSNAILYNTTPQLGAHNEILKPNRELLVPQLFFSFMFVVFDVL